jgi:hypothetical protein
MEIKNDVDFIQNFYCECCDFNTCRKNDYQRHLSTRKHIFNSKSSQIGKMEIEINQPELQKDTYDCNICSYSSTDKSNYNRHLISKKHINMINNIQKDNNCNICNKSFITYSGLYKHKKKCQVIENKNELTNEFRELDNKTPDITIDLVLDLIKQNKELQTILIEQNKEHSKQIMELSKNQSIINTTNNNNNNTTNNTQFNLQFFLNETCKDAMNIADFVNSLQVQIADLEKTGNLGYVEGISGIFLRGLRQLDISMRPIHCTDLKRETVYVKDENSWEKDDDEKAKLKLAIQRVARKNLRTLPKWQEENPDFRILDTKENDDYLKIALNSMGGQTDEQHDKYVEKIMRNVLKEVIIEKK